MLSATVFNSALRVKETTPFLWRNLHNTLQCTKLKIKVLCIRMVDHKMCYYKFKSDRDQGPVVKSIINLMGSLMSKY